MGKEGASFGNSSQLLAWGLGDHQTKFGVETGTYVFSLPGPGAYFSYFELSGLAVLR